MNDLLPIVTTLFGVAGAIAAIFFAKKNDELGRENLQLNHRNTKLAEWTAKLHEQTTFATIDIKIAHLPPYTVSNPFTEIVVKNVGLRVSGSLGVIVTCSWLQQFHLGLSLPSRNWILQPQEEYRWKLKLPEPPTTDNFTITVVATDHTTNQQWSQTEVHS